MTSLSSWVYLESNEQQSNEDETSIGAVHSIFLDLLTIWFLSSISCSLSLSLFIYFSPQPSQFHLTFWGYQISVMCVVQHFCAYTMFAALKVLFTWLFLLLGLSLSPSPFPLIPIFSLSSQFLRLSGIGCVLGAGFLYMYYAHYTREVSLELNIDLYFAMKSKSFKVAKHFKCLGWSPRFTLFFNWSYELSWLMIMYGQLVRLSLYVY